MWLAEERRAKLPRATLQERDDEPFDLALLKDMERDGLITANGEDLSLTGEGRTRAAGVIRRHRLAERLMHDVLELKEAVAESAACQFEHMLPEEVTESICTLLGHPKTCPHGHPIPPGACCHRAEDEVRPIVTSLDRMQTGSAGTVAYIATHHHHRLDKLAAFGLMPGARVRLHQRQPSFVIQMGETTIAVDAETAADIYVRQKGQ
jgi:DtxR family Mn-dependent transcriptional regulator